MEINYFLNYLRHQKIKITFLFFSLALYFAVVVVAWTLAESIPKIASVPLKNIGVQTIVQKEGKIPEMMIGAVFPHSNGPIQEEMAQKIWGLEFVESFDKGIYFWFFDQNSYKALLGIPKESGIFSEILKKNLLEGTFLSAQTDVLITQNFAEKRKLKLGSSLELDGITYNIVGILNSNMNGNIIPADIYLNIEEAQRVVQASSQIRKLYPTGQTFYNVILLKTDPSWRGNWEVLIKELDTNLIVFSEKTFGSEILDQLKLISSTGKTMLIFIGFLLIVAFILMLVFNLKTREKELAILRMLGWKIRDLKKQLMGEGFVILFCALILGNSVAYIGLELLSQQTISMELPWDISAKPHFLPDENNINRIIESKIPVAFDLRITLSVTVGFLLIFTVLHQLVFLKLKNMSPATFQD